NIILKGLLCRVYFGKRLAGVKDRAIVFFPYHDNRLCCGLTGIVAFKHKKTTDDRIDVGVLNPMLKKLEDHKVQNCRQDDLCFESHYLGGKDHVEALFKTVRSLKSNEAFYHLFVDPKRQEELSEFAGRLSEIIESESKILSDHLGRLQSKDVDILVRRIDILKDIAWCLTSEIAGNIKKIEHLLGSENQNPNIKVVNIFKQINAVLNSIDRLEVRGRDSAGVSMMFVLEGSEFERFKETLKKANLLEQLTERSDQDVLVNSGINLNQTKDENGQKRFTLALTYKIAAVVGRLGDNIHFLRKQIKDDGILQRLAGFLHEYHTISAHTRWASVGAITESNCHPVDNAILGNRVPEGGIIHACLNGDIDNYLDLKKEHERQGFFTHKDINTDTKIIPLQIGKYIRQGFDVAEAFRRAVNDFEGSHAISMHTDLAPGKLFLAQKGSGQAIFVGIAEDHYVPS
ncbi:MAG: glutamine--fructose-6-phosphate aminotransferase, partial [Desulfobacteraceae bacterium]|nr:glutamine--fructose-6-phosphate aminotransferase [Desulfobacteraceae bacterium]